MLLRGALLLVTGSVLLAVAPASAEPSPPKPSPYAGGQSRDIKALSARQLDDLRAGRGMSLALPAELNGFPGPRHVLDLAAELSLTPDQRQRTESLFADMQGKTVAIGDRVIEQERRLDALFAPGDPDPEAVRAVAARIAGRYGDLRFVHLRYHIEMRRILDPGQVAAYARLRGYDPGAGRLDRGQPGHGGHGGH